MSSPADAETSHAAIGARLAFPRPGGSDAAAETGAASEPHRSREDRG